MNQNIEVTHQRIHEVARQLNLGEGSAKEEGNAWSKLLTFNCKTSTVKFQNKQDRDDVLFSGPYSINSMGRRLSFKKSRTRRCGSRIVFARDTGRIPSSDDQYGLNGDGRDLGGTHLGRIVGVGGRQFLEKLNSDRKNFPMKVFLLFLGFDTANALVTILRQTGD
ncbi:Ycf20-like protein [Capsicum baccatum]|uniref:Ycf20-like protein n=1 Tax=Capsicum baccatum TaxID=33114 RepID=A0A2G2W617_CAPBA|nr:Ycf20-like protein [Capsicum baccatum]